MVTKYFKYIEWILLLDLSVKPAKCQLVIAITGLNSKHKILPSENS